MGHWAHLLSSSTEVTRGLQVHKVISTEPVNMTTVTEKKPVKGLPQFSRQNCPKQNARPEYLGG